MIRGAKFVASEIPSAALLREVVRVQKHYDRPSEDTMESPTDPVPVGTAKACQHVQFIEGSDPQIWSKRPICSAIRLRAAALSLFCGFGVFFVYRLISGSWNRRAAT